MIQILITSFAVLLMYQPGLEFYQQACNSFREAPKSIAPFSPRSPLQGLSQYNSVDDTSKSVVQPLLTPVMPLQIPDTQCSHCLNERLQERILDGRIYQ